MSQRIQPDSFLFRDVFRYQVSHLFNERGMAVSRKIIGIEKPLGQVLLFQQGEQGRSYEWIQIRLKGLG
jgi:hypothetical protein